MVKKVKECPNCGANIEGLLYRCDCCGAMLSNSDPVFVQYAHTMAETGDVASYMKDILDKINSARIDKFFPLDIIAFEIYCYPKDMVMKFNIRNKNYVSLRKKKAILTRIICYEEFATMRRSQKKAFLSKFVKECLLELCGRINKQDVEKIGIEIDAILR